MKYLLEQIAKTRRISDRIAWLNVCHDSGIKFEVFSQAERNKSCWTEDSVGKCRPRRAINVQPRSLYFADRAWRLLPFFRDSRSIAAVGGRNCRERAMTWNKSAGKYLSSVFRKPFWWPTHTISGIQFHQFSSWVWKKCRSSIEYCQSFTLSKNSVTRLFAYGLSGSWDTRLIYRDFTVKPASDFTVSGKRLRSFWDCSYEFLSIIYPYRRVIPTVTKEDRVLCAFVLEYPKEDISSPSVVVGPTIIVACDRLSVGSTAEIDWEFSCSFLQKMSGRKSTQRCSDRETHLRLHCRKELSKARKLFAYSPPLVVRIVSWRLTLVSHYICTDFPLDEQCNLNKASNDRTRASSCQPGLCVFGSSI